MCFDFYSQENFVVLFVFKDGKIEAEDFTSRLYRELNSSPQPYLVPFLKVIMRTPVQPCMLAGCSRPAGGEEGCAGAPARLKDLLSFPSGGSPVCCEAPDAAAADVQHPGRGLSPSREADRRGSQ